MGRSSLFIRTFPVLRNTKFVELDLVSYEICVMQILSGDTLDLIVSRDYQNLTTVRAITIASNLDSSGRITAGNPLTVPVTCFCGDPSINKAYGLFATYVVQAGDQLTGLASAFGVSAEDLSRFNLNVQDLSPNSIIFVPAKGISSSYVCNHFGGICLCSR